MRAAKIEDGKVVALWEVPNLECYGPDVMLVSPPDDAEVGWIHENGQITAPVKTEEELAAELLAAKLTKLAQITKDRDDACFADANVLGHPWQADSRSQQMLASAILLAQAGVYTPSVWRDANNVDVPITSVGQLVAIAGAMATQTQAAYAASWTRKQALEAATTIEEVEVV